MGQALLLVALDLGLGSLVIPPDYRSFRTQHPYYHHGFVPNADAKTRWGRMDYALRTNSLGLRDAEVRDVPLEAGARRVLLIGDSFLEGMGLDYEASVAGVLAQGLAGVEIINAAAVSYSPKLYYLKIKYLVEQSGLRFNELFVFIDVSDIQDEINYEAFAPSEDEPPAPAPRGFWKSHSLIAYCAGLLREAKRKGVDFRDFADLDVWFKSFRPQVPLDDSRWEWPFREDLRKAWGNRGLALARDNMSRLAGLCRERGIKLKVAVYPAPAQLAAGDRDSIQVRFWRKFCREKGAVFIDLFPLFFPTAGQPVQARKKYFIDGDMHWNADGNRMVAAALLPYLKR